MADKQDGALSQAIAVLTQETEDGRWLDTSVDPAAAEQVGAAIAQFAAEYNPQLVVTWLLPDESVLAHIVARDLGVSHAGAELDMGLITIDRDLEPGSRVLLVTTIDDSYRRLNSLNVLLSEQGHQVVAAAAVLPAGTTLIESDVPQTVLA